MYDISGLESLMLRYKSIETSITFFYNNLRDVKRAMYTLMKVMANS